jgi:hypothetical protein
MKQMVSCDRKEAIDAWLNQAESLLRARTSNWCALRTWPTERKRSA